MTKKHFIALADAIRNNGYVNFTDDHLEVLADFCKSQNGQFERQRWFDYIHGYCTANGRTIKP